MGGPKAVPSLITDAVSTLPTKKVFTDNAHVLPTLESSPWALERSNLLSSFPLWFPLQVSSRTPHYPSLLSDLLLETILPFAKTSYQCLKIKQFLLKFFKIDMYKAINM